METKAIIDSKLLAKAVIEKNGKIIIIAVFEKSEYYRFFFQFEANSRRSPRKAWRFTNLYYSVCAGTVWKSLEQYVEARYPACPCRIRYIIRKKSFDIWYERLAFPFRNYIQPSPLPGQTFGYANSISSGKPRRIAYRK